MRAVQALNWFGLANFKTNPNKLFVILAILLIIGGSIIWFYMLTTTAPIDKFEDIFTLRTTTVPTTTTKPILIKNVVGAALGYITNNQRGNIIYYGSSSSQTYTISPVANSTEYGTKDMKSVISIPLSPNNDPYIIKQIYISKFGDASPTGKKVRVSVVNTKENVVNFAGLHYNLTSGGEDEKVEEANQAASDTMFSRITQNANPADGIFLDDMKTTFGTDLIGNRINIFTDAEKVSNTMTIGNNNIKIIVIGYMDSQIWKPEYLNDTTQAAAASFPAGSMTLIRSISLTPDTKNTEAQNTALNGTKFFITFTNPYSNNIFTYPGPVGGGFIYSPDVPKIVLPKMLLTTALPQIVLATDAGNDGVASGPKIIPQSYEYTTKVSQGDITQFRLEYNLTDLRGSINPEYVCPDIQSLINKQLDAETIVDSMEYVDKINTEKAKMSSNKNNLLTLLKQEEDIKSLGAMITKINELMAKRTQETDALAAMQFTKQMNEIIKLRERLEQRIRERNRNTLNIQIAVNDTDAQKAAASGVINLGDAFKI